MKKLSQTMHLTEKTAAKEKLVHLGTYGTGTSSEVG